MADYVLTEKLNPEWRVSRDNIEAALDEVVRSGGIEPFLSKHVHIDPSVLKGVRENLLVL